MSLSFATLPWVLAVAGSLALPLRGPNQPAVEWIVLEPEGEAAEGELSPVKPLEDERRVEAIEKWLDNEAARFAASLYADAWLVAGLPEDGPLPFHIVVAPGGNHADRGLAIAGEDGLSELPDMPFVILDERPFRYEQTLAHETGHMVLDLLGAPQVAIDGGYVFHTTPAVTDRWTAFNEGFAIHLETLYMERASETGRRLHYDNRSNQHGAKGHHRFAPLDDLRTLSQTRQRYTAVRDNRFAHPAAYQGDDLLRHAVAPERDLSRLRNASQLLACEGFGATVFYRLVAGRSPNRTLDAVAHVPLLQALHAVFADGRGDADHTWLIHTVEELATMQRNARPAFLDLTRGATISSELVATWPDLHAAALRVDVALYKDLQGAAGETLDAWEAGLESGDVTLFDAVPPEVWATVPAVTVRPQLIPDEIPLCLDLNAADRAELSAIPGADTAWVDRVLAARLEAPFTSVDDLLQRSDAPEGLDAFVLPHDSTP